MSRSITTAQSYFNNLKRQFALRQYMIASDMEFGTSVMPRCDKSPIFFTTLQENIDSPGLLTELQRDNIIDYLEYLP